MTSAGLQELVADVAGKANVTIPFGQTVTGELVYDSHQQATGGSNDHFYVQLPASAPVPIAATDILFKPGFGSPADNAACTGTVSAPTAPPGKVCVYVSGTSGLTPASTTPIAGLLPTRGFKVAFIKDSPGTGVDMYLFATWAYTAPAAAPLTPADLAPPVIGEGKDG